VHKVFPCLFQKAAGGQGTVCGISGTLSEAAVEASPLADLLEAQSPSPGSLSQEIPFYHIKQYTILGK